MKKKRKTTKPAKGAKVLISSLALSSALMMTGNLIRLDRPEAIPTPTTIPATQKTVKVSLVRAAIPATAPVVAPVTTVPPAATTKPSGA